MHPMMINEIFAPAQLRRVEIMPLAGQYDIFQAMGSPFAAVDAVMKLDAKGRAANLPIRPRPLALTLIPLPDLPLDVSWNSGIG